jgi:hypothetical protein
VAQQSMHHFMHFDSLMDILTATEVERNYQNLDKAARKLKSSHKPRKIFQVLQYLMIDDGKRILNV